MNCASYVSGEQDRPPEQCWNGIGIWGDRSCPRLAEAGHCRNCPVFAAAGQQILEREPPPQYIEEWSRRIAQPEVAATTETIAVLLFRIAAEWLALDVRFTVEVVSPRPIHCVPHRAGRLLAGLVNVRGELQLCVSLQRLLGIQSNDTHKSETPANPAGSAQRLLVAQREHDRWVFPVDEVDGVRYVPLAALQELPATLLKGPQSYSRAVFSHEGRRVGLLSETHVFEALERAAR
jgi:chemotaxis-related protein WspD